VKLREEEKLMEERIRREAYGEADGSQEISAVFPIKHGRKILRKIGGFQGAARCQTTASCNSASINGYDRDSNSTILP